MGQMGEYGNIIFPLQFVSYHCRVQCNHSASSSGTDITPVTGSDLYFGFGGLALDPQKPGTVMVAALNSWWPDGQIFRSTNGGANWTALWEWTSYPNLNKYYTYTDTLAPWLGPDYTVDAITIDNQLGVQIGWMMEGKRVSAKVKTVC